MNNIAALALTLSAKPYLFHTSHTSLQKDFTHRVHVTAGVFPRQFSNGAAAHNPTRMAHSDSPFPIPETFFSLTLSAKPSGTVLLSIGLQCRGVYSTVPARVHGPTYGTLSSVSSMHATPCTHTRHDTVTTRPALINQTMRCCTHSWTGARQYGHTCISFEHGPHAHWGTRAGAEPEGARAQR